jgi:NADH-quinone oxidoreductase subunit N
VLTSVVGAYYYLRIVKIMYFDEPAEAFDRPIGRELRFILSASALFVGLFFLRPGLIVDGAGAAARVLFEG